MQYESLLPSTCILIPVLPFSYLNNLNATILLMVSTWLTIRHIITIGAVNLEITWPILKYLYFYKSPAIFYFSMLVLRHFMEVGLLLTVSLVYPS